MFVDDSEEVDGGAKSYYIFRRADVLNNVDRNGYEKALHNHDIVFLVGLG